MSDLAGRRARGGSRGPAPATVRATRELLEAAAVDRDREWRWRRDVCAAPSAAGHRRAVSCRVREPEQPAHGADEVLRRRPARWKPMTSAPSRPSRTCSAPRQLGEQLRTRGNGMWLKNPIAQVGALLAQHPRHELQLVVLHPHRRALGGHLGGGLGEPPVDADVGSHQSRWNDGWRDDVVVERPEGVVARSPRSTPRPPPRTARPGAGTSTRGSNGRVALPASPSQPTHAPPRSRMTESMAVTRPPGDRPSSPNRRAAVIRSTGSRFAAMTRSWRRFVAVIGEALLVIECLQPRRSRGGGLLGPWTEGCPRGVLASGAPLCGCTNVFP